MTRFCEKCGKELISNALFCSSCGNKIEQTIQQPQNQPQQYTQQQPVAQPPPNVPPSVQSSIWFQNYYRIRKKVVTVGNKYWIEDYSGNILGFCRQKLFKLKEDIRIFTDERQSQELFCIKQKQILDAFGNFGVIDSGSGALLGSIKRDWLSSAFATDKWEIYNPTNQLIGKIEETSAGSALARKYLPGGVLIPEKMTLELNGVPVAEINQSFKIIGDIWEMICKQIPPDFDRRVLLATMLLMGTIERSRK